MEHATLTEMTRIKALLLEAVTLVDEAIARTHAVDEPNVVVGNNVWRKPEVVALVARVVHLPAAKALFECCASAPGSWVSYQEICESAGHDNPRQTQNELSALTRHANRLLGRPAWPVEVRNGPPIQYRADRGMAAWLKEALVAVTST